MLKKYDFVFSELPVDQVAQDPDQPRKSFGTNGEGDENRLLRSIRDYGIEEPIKVTEVEKGRYIIIDGHRRYICSQKLGLATVPCRIYPKLESGELEARRYEMQNNRRPWKPLERSEALERIKNAMNFRTNHELADYLHLSKTAVTMSFALRRQNLNYISLMEKYELDDSYQFEFVTMYPKLRKIRNHEVSGILKILFEKIQHKVIYRAKDLRKIGKIFLRASTNEQEIFDFLSDPDMTIDELSQKTSQSGFLFNIEQLTEEIAEKLRDGIDFDHKEKVGLKQLIGVLQKSL